jgi:uroporphyrinogen III methyltransferase/synthase
VKVLVTQAREGAGRLAKRLGELGLEAIECPLVRIEPHAGDPVELGEYDWIVLTSARAVELLLARAQGVLPRVAAIGPGTAEALRHQGVEPGLIARVSTQEGLLTELPKPAGRVLFAGAEDARPLLARELRADFLPLYRTVEEQPQVVPEAELVVLASPSAARSFARTGRSEPCVSIGPLTTAEARRLGLTVEREADQHDLEGLAQAVRLAASELLERVEPSSPC